MVKLEMSPVELEDFLIKHDLTDKDFLELVGVTRPALDHWFKSRRKIPPTVIKIVRFLDRNPEMLSKFNG